jgi:hypothetical protein
VLSGLRRADPRPEFYRQWCVTVAPQRDNHRGDVYVTGHINIDQGCNHDEYLFFMPINFKPGTLANRHRRDTL